MKIPPSILLAASLTLMSGCASSTQYFRAAPGAGQKLVAIPPAKKIFGVQEIRDGIQSEVLFEPTASNKLFNGTAVFWVFAKNLGREPFQFSAANIRIVDKEGKDVPMLTLDQLVQKLQGNKTRQEWGYLFISSMASVLEAAPFMITQQTGTYSGYTSDGQFVTGTYAGTQQNTTVAYIAQQQNEARLGAFDAQMEAAFKRARSSVARLSLRGMTLGPGQKTEGIVTVPLLSGISLPNQYHFIVTIGNSRFEYDFPISNSAK